MPSLAKVKSTLLADAATRAAYEAQAPEFALARELIAARLRAGLTQAELAQRMGTTQSVVARMESGRTLPSLRTLTRYAEGTGSRTVVRLIKASETR